MSTEAPSKGLVLFVHGFGSAPRCWERMLQLLGTHDQVASRLDLHTWQYPTRWMEINPLRRIPDLRELGSALESELDSPKYRGRPLTLVGHSLGGLVTLTFIENLLRKGRASALLPIRQVILFATPCRGSNTASFARRMFSRFRKNPQEASLRILSEDVSDLLKLLTGRVVYSTTDSKIRCRVPISAFSGMEDNIVPRQSAEGPFHSVKSLPGDHFTILEPANHNDSRFTEFLELLLDPVGHAHRFEVELFENSLRVEPCERQSIRTASTTNPRTVHYDNFATVERAVAFSPGNRCEQAFTLSYGTRNEGYVIGRTSHPNEVDSKHKGVWEDTGSFFRFDFTPESGQRYCLKVDVYKGFDKGERNIHTHLGQHSYYRELSYKLDLSAYLAQGYVISTEPACHYSTRDHDHGEICKLREFGELVEVSSKSAEGVYQWLLRDKRTGIVDITWDVAKL